ncbi:uncharacterized protein LOC105829963 [Monomorium pharaonis]|uniref:uncharacterized protein LOC105829963 n=1 Tax=Monomorium pharaonis TaxID=307658 RepID=UPI001746F29C|nr:uncharacterized protein LOC105829963 [Monomorium pharaonis]XP_012524509.2 uncharacterized protein LOC105829963 [Monomorium pharaonis]XP_036143982.1 uncharacterized protein LOC105829963 [Monomorium pharaonis]
MLSLRRRHSRWRMFSVLLFLGLICSGELTPVRVPDETTTTSSTPKKKDIGSLSDYWQAWLLVDAQGAYQPGLDSATLLRRITPKSVFIAPVLPACAEGYHADKMGRCVKSIRLNATAHKDFILERLKIMFGNTQTSKNDQKKSTGPLQLNIPLIPNVDRQSTKIEIDEVFSDVAVPTRNETYFAGDEEKTKPHKMNQYEVKNNTTLDEEESTFFLENSSIDDIEKIDRKSSTMVPVTVAELVDETNDTYFSEVVDYKIPIDLKILLNSSSMKRVNVSDGVEENVSMAAKRENSTETSPALVLLISPTKLTNVVDDTSLTQNTTEQMIQTSNFTLNATTIATTTGGSIIVGISDSPPPPAKQLTSTSLDEQRDNETFAEDELTPETSKPNESQETEFVYDEEEDDADYSYSTDEPEEDDSAEGEELLKHGEAGMTIPTLDVERLDRHQRQRNQTTDQQKKTLEVHDQVMIRFNDSAPAEDKDEVESNISSEVSIDGDFILETTLLDVNTEKLQVTTTKPPEVLEKIIKNNEDGSKESFGKSPDVVPEVVFSQDAHSAVSTNSHERERIDQLSTRIENDRNEELETASSSSEPLLYDSPEEDPITDSRTINEKRSHAKESVLQETRKDSQSNVPANSSKQTAINFDSSEDFVRFPDYVRQQGSYVRFPSSEANSIHSLSYKQNSRYPADDVSSTSTKSSVPIRQKPVWFPYQAAPNWKQLDRVQVMASERQNRRPDLMRVWSKMPLIRDPTNYRVYQDQTTDNDQEQSYNRFFRARSSRRLSPITEISPENRVPTQKRRTPISV